jgi:hypothetical protein
MAHSRKDNYCAPLEWWKHLRPFNKRKMNRRERKAAQNRIKVDTKE